MQAIRGSASPPHPRGRWMGRDTGRDAHSNSPAAVSRCVQGLCGKACGDCGAGDRKPDRRMARREFGMAGRAAGAGVWYHGGASRHASSPRWAVAELRVMAVGIVLVVIGPCLVAADSRLIALPLHASFPNLATPRASRAAMLCSSPVPGSSWCSSCLPGGLLCLPRRRQLTDARMVHLPCATGGVLATHVATRERVTRGMVTGRTDRDLHAAEAPTSAGGSVAHGRVAGCAVRVFQLLELVWRPLASLSMPSHRQCEV